MKNKILYTLTMLMVLVTIINLWVFYSKLLFLITFILSLILLIKMNYNFILIFITTMCLLLFRISYVDSHINKTLLDAKRIIVEKFVDDNGVIVYHLVDDNNTVSIVSSESDKSDYFKIKSDYLSGKQCYYETNKYFYHNTYFERVSNEINCWEMRD